MTTFAEDAQQAAEVALEHFRESFLLCFRTMTDGLPEQYRKQAREVIKFFETETDAAVWARLKMIPDPDSPGRSLADSWIAQWEQLAVATGRAKEPAGVVVKPTVFSKGA